MKREMGRLLTLYPPLQNAVSERHGDFIRIIAPAGGGCVFLGSDNLCGIQREHGEALKPTMCMMFPFNTLNRVGETIVVSPHFACPLRLRLPAGLGEVEGKHSVIERRIRQLNFLDEGYLAGFAPVLPLHAAQSPEQVVLREVAFRDLSADALGSRSFAEVLHEASGDARELTRNIARGAKVLGLPKARKKSRDAIDDLLLALAPSLRLKLLRLPPEGILVALALSEIAFRRITADSNKAPTLQGAYHVFMTIGPALRLIGLINEPIGYSKVASVEGPHSWNPEMKVMARVILRQAQGSTGAIEALERALPSSLSVADRSALLIQIGRAVEHVRGAGG